MGQPSNQTVAGAADSLPEGLRLDTWHIDTFGQPPRSIWHVRATIPDGSDEGRLIGRLDFSEFEDQYLIDMIAVHPDFRRRGIGLALMHELMKVAPWDEIKKTYQSEEGRRLVEAVERDRASRTAPSRSTSGPEISRRLLVPEGLPLPKPGGRRPEIPGFRWLRSQTFSTPAAPPRTVEIYLCEAFHRAIRAAEGTTQPECEFVLVPGGEFLMGSTAGELDEQPVHLVRIAPFLMARTPVIDLVWRNLHQPLIPGNTQHPFSAQGAVDWWEVGNWCTAQGMRLPSEAEWEYACRAGSTTAWCFGDDEALLPEWAWFYTNQVGRAESFPVVGQKRPNAFGLLDMHGYVWEWCQDSYEDSYREAPTDGSVVVPRSGASYRVLRGGCWFYNAAYCRSASRDWDTPGLRSDLLGFRPVVWLGDYTLSWPPTGTSALTIRSAPGTTGVLLPCKQKDIIDERTWCIYKHDENDHSKAAAFQPKGWPRHFISEEAGKRGLAAMHAHAGSPPMSPFRILIVPVHEAWVHRMSKQLVGDARPQVRDMWSTEGKQGVVLVAFLPEELEDLRKWVKTIQDQPPQISQGTGHGNMRTAAARGLQLRWAAPWPPEPSRSIWIPGALLDKLRGEGWPDLRMLPEIPPDRLPQVQSAITRREGLPPVMRPVPLEGKGHFDVRYHPHGSRARITGVAMSGTLTARIIGWSWMFLTGKLSLRLLTSPDDEGSSPAVVGGSPDWTPPDESRVQMPGTSRQLSESTQLPVTRKRVPLTRSRELPDPQRPGDAQGLLLALHACGAGRPASRSLDDLRRERD